MIMYANGKRLDVETIMRKYRNDRSNRNRLHYSNLRNKYKALLREKRGNHRKDQLNKLCKVGQKQFWPMLKRIRGQKQPNNIPIENWFEYFSNHFQPDYSNPNSINTDYLETVDNYDDFNDELNRHIREDEIKSAIHS